MKPLLIKRSALSQFVEKGYEGTSLSDIVEEVGIKKQSIYAHFRHKEDIFLQVMYQVIEEEISFLKQFFEEHQPLSLHDQLFGLILRYKERYLEEESNIKFLLRMAFMPPIHLLETVKEHFNYYYNELEKLVNQSFSSTASLSVSAEEGANAFLNFLDGVLVELIYSSIEKFNARLDVSWHIFWRGISK